MNIKLLALDADDTLVYDISRLSEEDRQAVLKAQEAGVMVTLATGRGFLASTPVWKAVGIQGPVINYGGALVTDTRTGECLHATEIPNQIIQEIFSIAEEEGFYAQLYQGDTVITLREHFCAKAYGERLGVPVKIDPELRSRQWSKVPKVLYIVEPERAASVIGRMQKHFAGRLKVSGSSPGFVEFNDPKAHKGAALEWLAQSCGIPQENVAAMGDNTLDLEMIQWAGVGVAMGNALPVVKEAADMIAPACRENGVAWFINEYILKG